MDHDQQTFDRKHPGEENMMQQQQDTSTTPLLLTMDQMMQKLQLGRNKVYQLIYREGFPVLRFGRAIRFDPDAVEAWLKARRSDQ